MLNQQTVIVKKKHSLRPLMLVMYWWSILDVKTRCKSYQFSHMKVAPSFIILSSQCPQHNLNVVEKGVENSSFRSTSEYPEGGDPGALLRNDFSLVSCQNILILESHLRILLEHAGFFFSLQIKFLIWLESHLSGWEAHTLSTTSMDLSLPATIVKPQTNPLKKE